MPMSSLQAHLERHDLAVSPLEFRRDCPLCRAERVHGQSAERGARATSRVRGDDRGRRGHQRGRAGHGCGRRMARASPCRLRRPRRLRRCPTSESAAAVVPRRSTATTAPGKSQRTPAIKARTAHARPSERAQETESGSGAVAPSESRSLEPGADRAARQRRLGWLGRRGHRAARPCRGTCGRQRPGRASGRAGSPSGHAGPGRRSGAVAGRASGAGAVACSVGYRPRDPEPRPSRLARERPGRRRQPLRRLTGTPCFHVRASLFVEFRRDRWRRSRRSA